MLAISSDLRACEGMIRRGSKSFFLSSLLLPRRVRTHSYALYAFCRLADDLVDDAAPSSGSHDALAPVDALTCRLDEIYAQRPRNHFVDRALAATVQTYQLPRGVFDALLEGFRWDASEQSYESLEDLLAYCARVAATVGVLMTLLMQQRHPATLARACDLGTAMQLTNIARDVGEDARRGRIYLPLRWMREAGIDPAAWQKAPCYSAALAGVVRRLLEEAQFLYRRAESGVGRLPHDCRWAIATASHVYSSIGDRVTLAGFDSISQRAIVSWHHKLALLALAGARGVWPQRTDEYAPALPSSQFLIDLVVG